MYRYYEGENKVNCFVVKEVYEYVQSLEKNPQKMVIELYHTKIWLKNCQTVRATQQLEWPLSQDFITSPLKTNNRGETNFCREIARLMR